MVFDVKDVPDPRGGPEDAYLEALVEEQPKESLRQVARLLIETGFEPIEVMVSLDYIRGLSERRIAKDRDLTRARVRRILRRTKPLLKY